MEKKKYIPKRMCAGCRERVNKPDLIRIIIDNAQLVIDQKQNKLSKGAYLCKKKECVLLAKKKNVFSKILRGKVSDEFYEEILKYVQ